MSGAASRPAVGKGEQPVAQLARHDRRLLQVRFIRAADVGDKERPARRKQQIQKNVSVVDAAVAGAAPRRRAHEVKFLKAHRAGEAAIVIESDDGDDFVGKPPQRRHACEGDGAPRPSSARGFAEPLQKHLHEERERHRKIICVFARSGSEFNLCANGIGS